MPRRPHALVAPLLVLALVGCTPTTVIPPAGAPSEEVPLFASDDEALAAATEAYEEFLAVSSQILQDGGREPERAAPYLSEDVFEEELLGYEQFVQNRYRLTGESTISNAVLQQWSSTAGQVEIVAYFCVTLEGTDVVNESGESVVGDARPIESALEIVFSGDSEALRIVRKQAWPDDSVCE